MSKTDYQAGKRYELVKAALSGGCQEIIGEIDNIISYIDTGDKRFIASAVERKKKEKDQLDSEYQEYEAAISEVKKELSSLTDNWKEIDREIEIVIAEVKKDMDSHRAEIEEEASNLSKLQGSLVLNFNSKGQNPLKGISDSDYAYVLIDNFAHKVDGYRRIGNKVFVNIEKVGYKVTNYTPPCSFSRAKANTHIVRVNSCMAEMTNLLGALNTALQKIKYISWSHIPRI